MRWYAVGAIKDGWNGLGILHTAASRVGGLDVGFVPGVKTRVDVEADFGFGIEVGIGEDDNRPLAAKLQSHPFDGGRGKGADLAADTLRAGEGDPAVHDRHLAVIAQVQPCSLET